MSSDGNSKSERNSARENEPAGSRLLPSRLRGELGANAILLVALVLLLAVVPFLPGGEIEGSLSRLVWSGAIVAGIFKASGRPFFLWAALIIAIPSLLSRWVDIFGLGNAGPIFVALFFGLIAAHILADIFSRRSVQVDQILGAVNVFLLLGVMFSRLHSAVEDYAPNSYMQGDVPLAEVVELAGQNLDDTLLYFSFTTLTTLGYGDIRPASQAARTLSTLEAVVGQLFVAILIARLVSAHASRFKDSDERDD